MTNKLQGRSKGGAALAAKMTIEQRKEKSMKMVKAKKDLAGLRRATHGSSDHPLIIGTSEIPCYVLEDDTRVLSQRGLQIGIGMSSSGGSKVGEQRLVSFFMSLLEKSKENKEMCVRIEAVIEKLKNPINFRLPMVGTAFGYEATILADICDVILSARQDGYLQKQQLHIAQQCEVLVRGFARIGIIALVDEVTGYQRDRAKDALAKILEAFVAKELQPYLKTFPSDYYEQLFRLYELPYPPVENKSWRPAFFGHITNDVVYSRLAPELLPELKKAASKAERKAKLHQWLTHDIGHPKLRDHLISIVSILKISKTPDDFKANVNLVHPKLGETGSFDFSMPKMNDKD